MDSCDSEVWGSVTSLCHMCLLACSLGWHHLLEGAQAFPAGVAWWVRLWGQSWEGAGVSQLTPFWSGSCWRHGVSA